MNLKRLHNIDPHVLSIAISLVGWSMPTPSFERIEKPLSQHRMLTRNDS
jgi:hypothetical protein